MGVTPPLTTPTTVLLLEDDEAVRALVQQVLAVKGYAVESAADGLAALALLEAKRFDVVLADKNVPKLSGLEVARRVRERWPEVAVVLMTAFPESGALANAPVDGYLPKPFKGLDSLVRSLTEALERRARSRQIEALQAKLTSVSGTLRD
jgi:CheY-like chemotaxis protein